MTLEQQYINLTAAHMQDLVKRGHNGERNAWQELAYIEKKHSPSMYQAILKAVMALRVGD